MDSSEVHPGIKAESAENLAVLHLVLDHDRDAARFLLTARKVGCHRLPACLGSSLPYQCGQQPLLTVDHLSLHNIPTSSACVLQLHATEYAQRHPPCMLPHFYKTGQIHALLDFEDGGQPVIA